MCGRGGATRAAGGDMDAGRLDGVGVAANRRAGMRHSLPGEAPVGCLYLPVVCCRWHAQGGVRAEHGMRLQRARGGLRRGQHRHPSRPRRSPHRSTISQGYTYPGHRYGEQPAGGQPPSTPATVTQQSQPTPHPTVEAPHFTHLNNPQPPRLLGALVRKRARRIGVLAGKQSTRLHCNGAHLPG